MLVLLSNSMYDLRCAAVSLVIGLVRNSRTGSAFSPIVKLKRKPIKTSIPIGDAKMTSASRKTRPAPDWMKFRPAKKIAARIHPTIANPRRTSRASIVLWPMRRALLFVSSTGR